MGLGRFFYSRPARVGNFFISLSINSSSSFLARADFLKLLDLVKSVRFPFSSAASASPSAEVSRDSMPLSMRVRFFPNS